MEQKVYILSKNPIASRNLEKQLETLGFCAESHVSMSSLIKSPGVKNVQTFLIDKITGDNQAEEWIAQLRQKFPQSCLLLMISPKEDHLLINYVQKGITDVIHKPWHKQTLSLRLKVHSARGFATNDKTKANIVVVPVNEESVRHVS